MTIPSSVCSLVAALAMAFVALGAYRSDRAASTFVAGCDPFGYERMARVVRQARTDGSPPDYFIHDDQTRWLIGKFKENGFPAEEWDEVVTTHAHHYFPGSDQVGPQYPPGTGWVLSLFPAGADVGALDRLTLVLVVAGGWGLAAWCAWRGLAVSSLVLAGSIATVLAPYRWVMASSYSINATILPLFAGTLLAWMASRARRRWTSVALGFGAGLLFGLLIQVRLASALLAPAAALLLVPRRIVALPGYVLGVFLTGIVPVLLHNRVITGSMLGATYSGNDRMQGLGCLADNLRFYFGSHVHETGGLYLLGLVLAVGLWLALVAATRPRGTATGWKTWLADHCGLVAAPFCAVGLSAAYFLTHVVTTIYYLVPATVLTGLLLGLLFVSLETRWQEAAGASVAAGRLRVGAAVLAVAAAFLAAGLGHRAIPHLVRAALEAHDDPPQTLAVPAEILQPRAWVWGDYLSSSIIYYTGHPAFKLCFASPAMRHRLYGWVQAKGDPQYLVADSEVITGFLDAERAAGWRLTPVGHVRESVCYRIEAAP